MAAWWGFCPVWSGAPGRWDQSFFSRWNCPPFAYIASDAFTSLTMHAAKTLVYQRQLALPPQICSLALLLGVAMILGTWVSKKFIERMRPERFRRYVTLLLGVIALQMIIFG